MNNNVKITQPIKHSTYQFRSRKNKLLMPLVISVLYIVVSLIMPTHSHAINTECGVDVSSAKNNYDGRSFWPNSVSFVAMKSDGSITAWGDENRGGNGAPTDLGYVSIIPSRYAFAALKNDGSIKAWGRDLNGGVGAPEDFGYISIASTSSAFAAMKSDGSITAWGNSQGSTGAPNDPGYVSIVSTQSSFAALKDDGSISAWGDSQGGTGAPVGTGYKYIVPSGQAFAALKEDGSITAWGVSAAGGSGAPLDSGYISISSASSAFAAMKSDGSITAWGNINGGGTGAPVGTDFVSIVATDGAFAALKNDGSIISWGGVQFGGGQVFTDLRYVQIYANGQAFAALTSDGSIITWGQGSSVAPVDNGYVSISSNLFTFAALKDDGSISAWGQSEYGVIDVPESSGYVSINGVGLNTPTDCSFTLDLAPENSLLTSNPLSIDFGSQTLDITSDPLLIDISNDGNAVAHIGMVGLAGSNLNDFIIVDNGCSGIDLAPAETCSLSVTFSPSVLGGRNANLNISDIDSNVLLSVPLSGTGVTENPLLTSNPLSINFENQILGITSDPQLVDISNDGNAVAHIGMVGLAGSNLNDFIIVDNGCSGIDLAPTETCSLLLTFSPSAMGERNANLNLSDIDSNVLLSVPLSGTGVEEFNTLAPILSSISPDSGNAGTIVTLRGKNFGDIQESGYVTFSNDSQTVKINNVKSWNNNRIDVYAPAGFFDYTAVTITTVGGSSSNIDAIFRFPSKLDFRYYNSFPNIQERQNFGLFKPSDAQPQLAFLAFSSQEIKDPTQEEFNINGQIKTDLCYGGAMQAASKDQGNKIKQSSIKNLYVDIVKKTIGLISTGNPFFDLLIQSTGEGIGAAISEDSIASAVSSKVAERIGGFMLGRYTDDWFGDKTFSISLDLSRNGIKDVLNDEGILPWNLSGDNFSIFEDKGGFYELADVKARLYYNPWNHYTTAIIGATCQKENGSSYQNVYVVTYENEKTIFNGAEPILDTVVRRLVFTK